MAQLTQKQAQQLEDIRYAKRFGLSAFNSHDLPNVLLDIIDTLLSPDATDQMTDDQLPNTATGIDGSDYEWDDQRRNWFKKAGG